MHLPAPFVEKYNEDGSLASKEATMTLEEWQSLAIAHMKAWAGRILAETDWMAIKAFETGQPLDPAVSASRQAVRHITNAAEAAIMEAETLEDAAAVPWSGALTEHDTTLEPLEIPTP